MNSRSIILLSLLAITVCITPLIFVEGNNRGIRWTQEELLLIDSLRLANLPRPPPDPTNMVADSAKAVTFGHQLFFDTRLSINGAVSCATCHIPLNYFSDNQQFSNGIKRGERNTPALVGIAYSPWFFWDGRRDSLWAQALSPLENTLEHGSTRSLIAKLIREDKDYRIQYESLFGIFPDIKLAEQNTSPKGESEKLISQVFSNVGKVLASYQREIKPGPTAFDQFADALLSGDYENSYLSGAAQEGLKLFLGKANCINCHNGPLLSNNEFHNTGVLPAPKQLPSLGRSAGIRNALSNEFNCLSSYSDSNNDCSELLHAKMGKELIGAHRTPTLRNISKTSPYMHAGQIKTIGEVLNHYNRAAISIVGHNEAKPLNLTESELQMLESFLLALTGPIDMSDELMFPPLQKITK